MDRNLDGEDLRSEIKGKTIIHWNYRSLARLPEAIRFCARDVREIYLKDNELQNLPDWMVELVNLTHLYLNGNNLRRMPDQLAVVPRLALLDLGKNGISDLSPGIGDLQTLETLILDDNFLKKVPSELSNLKNLRTLSICNNELVVLPEWLGRLERLEQLRVDENYLKELPNSLTAAARLSILSICSNRLTHLPFNAFVSRPSVYFRSNPGLNYLSYPMFQQLFDTPGEPNRVELAKYETGDESVTRETKNLRISVTSREIGKCVIELPRQLMKIHTADANKPATLWELAVRRIYSCERDGKKTRRDKAILGVPYNVLVNGPIAICVNENCREAIFTEAWLIAAISCPGDSFSGRIPIAVLYCSRNCALNFDSLSEEFEPLRWQHVHQR